MLVFIPIMGVLADRFGAHRLVAVNVLLGVGANLGFMAAGNELGLIAATVLHSAMWATLGGIGITVAQDLYPNGIGMASSLYFSAIRFAAAIGGVAGGLGVGWFGVPGVFLVPALLCIVAAVGLLTQAFIWHQTGNSTVESEAFDRSSCPSSRSEPVVTSPIRQSHDHASAG
jgi:SET family sugar efflux transporter-like MFS transporter